MTHQIKIPLHTLDEAKVQELKEKYPGAELNVVLYPEGGASTMSDDEFWEIIEQLDWEQPEDDAILAPAVKALAERSVRQIYDFANALSHRLFQLDQYELARHIGVDAWRKDRYFSVDNFLYVRACVIANGRRFFEQVLQEPSAMPEDISFEALLYLPQLAYEAKTGEKYDYVPAFPIETYSNIKGWKSVKTST